MKWWSKNQNLPWLVLGILGMLVSVVPNLILGMDSIFTYHDQLDGELIAYILQARNLFTEGLPEFMGGSPKTALTLPAPIFVFLFLGDNYFPALLIMLLLGRIAGFVGMYLLARECKVPTFIAAVAGGLYGLLPFLPVYGLSQFGIPMLLWCALRLRKKRTLVFSYCYVAFYALGSSLVLVGFGVLGMGLLWLLWDVLQWRKGVRDKQGILRLGAAWGFLLLIYVAENISLLGQMLGALGEGVSHKAEYVLQATPFVPTFIEKLFYGGQHSEGYQSLLLPACLGAVAVSLWAVRAFSVEGRIEGKKGLRLKEAVRKGEAVQEEKGKLSGFLRTMGLCLLCNLFFALVAALWSVEPIVNLRASMGALGAFQVERLLWMAPCLWYLFGALGAATLVELFKGATRKIGKVVVLFCGGVLLLAVAVTGVRIFLNGDVKSNIQKLRNPEYGLLSFKEYYAIGVLEQVEDFLRERSGLESSGYRVVSLGIDPAAALYHGFYCLDGYSNNYSLAYKHAFRRVIAPELEKSEYLRKYFDEWGNRCYLFSAEVPGYYTIEKNGFYFQDYQLDTEALRELGCDYLFSAAYIMDGEKQGLELLNEVPFETLDSYYRIWVYEICK